MNPIDLKEAINLALRNNLLEKLAVSNADEETGQAIEKAANEYPFVSNPFIEQQPLYKYGNSLDELIREDLLHEKTARLFALSRGVKNSEIDLNNFYQEFHLYEHQQRSLEAVSKDQKNLVVCSGTGSGKTECFLLPLLDYLVREKLEQKVHEKGVRALLLYPMNALVNDQLGRLRSILKHCRDIVELKDCPITFGRFTGETLIQENKPYALSSEQKAAAQQFFEEAKSRDGGCLDSSAICDNEVRKRSDWCNEKGEEKGPADILVTNYSMLERLLLKPSSSAIFTRGDFWKFIILDEAHSYDGSKGTEIAWLVRRLCQRVHKAGELRFLATSATLIDGSSEELRQVLINANIDRSIWGDEQGAERLKEIFIKHAFASQIFPAPPESFFIEFGQLEGSPEPSDYVGKNTVEDYIKQDVPDEIRECVNKINELKEQWPQNKISDLKAFLPWFFGVEDFWSQGIKQLNHYAGKDGSMSAGSVLKLLLAMVRLSKALPSSITLNRKESIAKQIEIDSILKGQSKEFFSWILGILSDHIAPLCKDDLRNNESWYSVQKKWGSRLHNELDIESSLKSKEECGNRVALLNEWVKLRDGDLSCLTIEGLEYILSIGHECLLDSDESDYSPVYLPIWVTDDFLQYAQNLLNKLQDVDRSVKAIKKMLETDIERAFGSFHGTIEKTLGHVLLATDSDYLRLRDYIQQCHLRLNGKKPADSEFSRVAGALFPDFIQEEAEDLLNTLNTAASFGKNINDRPLWDIRYHQMIRGVPAATIQFNVEKVPDEDEEAPANYCLSKPRVEFGAGIINDHGGGESLGESMKFPLGLCRKCGQPYLIGFAHAMEIPTDDKGLQLYPNQSEHHQHMHALSWCEHKEEGGKDSGDITYRFMDPYKGKIYKDLKGHLPLVGCCYYANEKERDGVINRCPCCGLSQSKKGVEKGIITLYSSTGDANKSVSIAAILEQMPPSSNPEARGYPGQGRKMIAFSDNRLRAAKLSLDFDRHIRERNVDALLYKALRQNDRNPEEGDLDGDLPPSKESIASLGFAFRDQIRAHELSEQYLMIDYDPYGDAKTVVPMRGWDAAIAQLIGALRRKGIYRALDRAGGRMDYKDRQDLLDKLAKRAERSELEFDMKTAETGFFELLNWLFVNSMIIRERNGYYYPESIVYPGQAFWYRKIVRNKSSKESNSISFEGSRKLEELMKISLKGDSDKIKKCLNNWLQDDVWISFSSLSKSFIKEGMLQPLCPRLQILPNETCVIPPQEPLSIRIEEHTAQINSHLGNLYQNAFAAGQINVLSCSTTFEMGVDLGDLSCVFLCNQPPSVANYKQRAGRAGRRAGMGAMVLTFIGADSHDSYYFEHPDEMFFGMVTPPMIYLENPVFRARHLRSEALHRFLQWKVSMQPKEKAKLWENVGWFFFGVSAYKSKKNRTHQYIRTGDGMADCWISDIEQWAKEEHKSADFGEHIRQIIGDQDIDYDVIADLVWQLSGMMSPSQKMTRDLCFRLAGPNMGDKTDVSLKERMIQKLFYLAAMPENSKINDFFVKWPKDEVIKEEVGEDVKSWGLRHLFAESTISYLTTNRILPLYGFPSDVIELKKHPDDWHVNVELSRDMKQGIYEYAPGRSVMANKRVFISNRPVFYNSPRVGDKGGQLPANIAIAKVCAKCGTVFEQDQSFCCGRGPLCALRPDSFEAAPSLSGQSYDHLSYESRIQRTPGNTKTYYSIEGTNIQVSENEQKKVVYLNTNNGEGFLYNPNGSWRYCLMHTVHTDVLRIQLMNQLPGWSNERKNNAWDSVAASLQRAMQTVLKVQKSDVGIISNSKDNSWSLYDTSPGGAGFIHRLLLSEEAICQMDSNQIEQRINLIKCIVCEARDICKGKCCCCYDKNKLNHLDPGDLGDVIDHPDKYRHRYSCYRCLRDFTNRGKHDILDVTDAAKILDLMLGTEA